MLIFFEGTGVSWGFTGFSTGGFSFYTRFFLSTLIVSKINFGFSGAGRLMTCGITDMTVSGSCCCGSSY
jgi:hypothetical protein